MSYYEKDENTESAPGTGSRRYTGFEQWQKAMQDKLTADANKFHSRFDADDDLKAHKKEEAKKFNQDK